MKDMVCIITGAGSGMGKALAHRLAKAGCKLVLAGRSADKLEQAAAEFLDTKCDLRTFALDVADEPAVEAMVRSVINDFGRIDVLVNNAGHSSRNRRLFNTSLDEIHGVINSNLVGTILCSRAVLKHMLERKTGTILNVSSRSGTHASPFGGMIYCAAKSAVINFTYYLQEEFKNTGVRFSVIIPGEVNTPILDGRPIPPSMDARETMVPAETAADVMFGYLSLPQSTNIPRLDLMPTMLRDMSKELQPA